MMAGMRPSVFSQLSSLVSVRDLQAPLGPDVPPDADAEQLDDIIFSTAAEQGYDGTERVSPVREAGRTLGLVWFDAFAVDPEPRSVREAMEPIPANRMLAAATDYFSAVEILSRASSPSVFFVLERNEITGTLSHNDLFRLPGRLCLFSLTLELEQTGLGLCLISPEESWNSLPHERRSKAEQTFGKRHPKARSDPPPFAQMLEYTMFCDKGTMLGKNRALSPESRTLAKRVFSKADEVRNACAHTGAEDRLPGVLGRDRLYSFIGDAQSALIALRTALEAAP